MSSLCRVFAQKGRAGDGEIVRLVRGCGALGCESEPEMASAFVIGRELPGCERGSSIFFGMVCILPTQKDAASNLGRFIATSKRLTLDGELANMTTIQTT